MSHEPECDYIQPLTGNKLCICEQVRSAYRRGYNDAKRTRVELESMFGPYIQHGKGENP